MKITKFILGVVFLSLSEVISARTTKAPPKEEKSKKVNKRLDSGAFENGIIESGSFDGFLHSGGGGGEEKGYSVGSGLRSIAQGSAHQAHSAVANQQAAAIQASYVAKNTLAQAAVQAAATAHAALAGKEVLLQELEHQSIEAHHILEAELAQLQLSKQAAALAKQVAQQAASHVAILSSALNSAQGVSEQAEQAAHQTSQEAASQSAMVGKAKARLHEIKEHLKAAQIDYEATKHATEKAAAAAQEAQNNAAAAAAHAHVELTETAVKKTADIGGVGGGQEIQQIVTGEEHGHPF